jgi:3-oxoacyl-[acyl-carrier protein] reductase
MSDLTGRRAIVCGATQGIGRATAEILATHGATVTLVARNERALEDAVSALPVPAGQAHDRLTADFEDCEQVAARVRAHLERSGPVHILVNNTGGPPGGRLLDAEPADFTRALSMHVVCNHLLVGAVVPGMTAEGYGRIINVISTSVIAPIPGLGVSNTVRAAVANWARTLSDELGPSGITVNNVLPGFTNTQRLQSLIERRAAAEQVTETELIEAWQAGIPLRRFADPHEIGAVIAFLASPDASYVTGVNLPVDGGRTASQ